MQRWTHLADHVRRGLRVFGATLILLITAGICLEVTLRKVFGITLGGVDELAGYGFAIFTSFALSVAALDRAHIRIDVVRGILPSKVRIGLDLIAQIALLGFVFFLTYRAALLVLASWENGTRAITPLATPVAWPQTIWLIGLAFFAVTLLVMLVMSCIALAKRDQALFRELAVPSSELDELETMSAAPGADRHKAT